MAPKQPCAKYEYVLTDGGPKIIPVPDQESKVEESPADYNAGGYLPVKVNDSFRHGRYHVLRKLGSAFVSNPLSLCISSPFF
jgi:serine/threonine-protein kinase SRPK3